MPTTDYRAAYAAAEAARISLAAELASLRAEVRRERALRAHPTLEAREVIDLVHGADDDDYAANARRLAEAIEAAKAGA